MKNLKSFAERHNFIIAISGGLVLGLAGGYLGVAFNYFWFLLVALALLLYLLLFRHCFNIDWVCTKCGEKALITRHKFCSKCGGIMHAVKKEKIFCFRGHKVEKYYKFCPRCGLSLNG